MKIQPVTSKIYPLCGLLLVSLTSASSLAQSAAPTRADFTLTQVTGMNLLVDGKAWKINNVEHSYYNDRNNVLVFCDEGTFELNVEYQTPKARAGFILDKDHNAQASLDVKPGDGKTSYSSVFIIGDKRGEPPGWAKNGCGPVWFNAPELGYYKPYQAACDLTLSVEDMKTIRVVLATVGRLEAVILLPASKNKTAAMRIKRDTDRTIEHRWCAYKTRPFRSSSLTKSDNATRIL